MGRGDRMWGPWASWYVFSTSAAFPVGEQLTLSLTGIQYAKAMGYKVAAIDISDAQLSNARSLGADLIYNSMADSTYLEKIKEETQGGCHAAIVFSAALPAYEHAPKCLR